MEYEKTITYVQMHKTYAAIKQLTWQSLQAAQILPASNYRLPYQTMQGTA